MSATYTVTYIDESNAALQKTFVYAQTPSVLLSWMDDSAWREAGRIPRCAGVILGLWSTVPWACLYPEKPGSTIWKWTLTPEIRSFLGSYVDTLESQRYSVTPAPETPKDKKYAPCTACTKQYLTDQFDKGNGLCPLCTAMVRADAAAQKFQEGQFNRWVDEANRQAEQPVSEKALQQWKGLNEQVRGAARYAEQNRQAAYDPIIAPRPRRDDLDALQQMQDLMLRQMRVALPSPLLKPKSEAKEVQIAPIKTKRKFRF